MIKVGDKVIFKDSDSIVASDLLFVVIKISGLGLFKKCDLLGYNDNARITFVDGIRSNKLIKLRFDDAFSIIHEEYTVSDIRNKLTNRKDDLND